MNLPQRNALEDTWVFSDELFNCLDGGMNYEELKESLSNTWHLQDTRPNGLFAADKCTTVNFEPKITATFSLDPRRTNSTGFARSAMNFAEKKAVDTPRPTPTMDYFLPDHLGGWHTMENMIQNEEETFRQRWATSTVGENVSKQAAVDAEYYAENEYLSPDYHAIKHVKRGPFTPSVGHKVRRQDAGNFDNGNRIPYKFEESRKNVSSIDRITNGPQHTGWQLKTDHSACTTSEMFWPVDFSGHELEPSKDVILPLKPHEGFLFEETNLSVPSVAPFQSYGPKIHPTHWDNSFETHSAFHPCPGVFVNCTNQDMHKGKNAANWELEPREANLISPKENIRQFYDQPGSSGMWLNSQLPFPGKGEGPAGWSLASAHKSDPSRPKDYVHQVHQSVAQEKSHHQLPSQSADVHLLYVGTRDDRTVTGLKPKGEIPSRSKMKSPTHRPRYGQKHGEISRPTHCCHADDTSTHCQRQASRQTHQPTFTQKESLFVRRSTRVDTYSKSSKERLPARGVRRPSGSRRSGMKLLRAPIPVQLKNILPCKCEEWAQAERTVERLPNYSNLTPPVTAACLLKMPQQDRVKRVPDHIYLELLKPPQIVDVEEYGRGKTAFYRRTREYLVEQNSDSAWTTNLENCTSTAW